MSHDNVKKIKAFPSASSKSNKSLGKAMADLAPLIKKAKEKLYDLPLREIFNEHKGVYEHVHLASAQELQRIVMETCEGRIIVNTLPVMLGVKPSVVANIFILTDEGFVKLPGACATKHIEVASTSKPLLEAESKAIKRAFRALGLRCESDAFDTEEADRKAQSMRDEKKSDTQSSEDKEREVSDSVDAKNTANADTDADDIPEMPENFGKDDKPTLSKGSDKKNSKTGSASKVSNKTNTAQKGASKSTTSTRRTSDKSTKKVEVEIPSEPLNVVVDETAKGWPSSKGTGRYISDILDALSAKCKELKITEKIFIKHVLGEKTDRARIKSVTMGQARTLYQYYIVENARQESK
jgi:hypothetical protein